MTIASFPTIRRPRSFAAGAVGVVLALVLAAWLSSLGFSFGIGSSVPTRPPVDAGSAG